MKFSAFKEFRRAASTMLNDVTRYLDVDVTKILRELRVGLTRLKFTENFESFKVTVTIPATSELQIRNQLISGIPTERIVVRGNESDIVDGDTEWTQNFVYLKNNSGNIATVTVIFLK